MLFENFFKSPKKKPPQSDKAAPELLPPVEAVPEEPDPPREIARNPREELAAHCDTLGFETARVSGAVKKQAAVEQGLEGQAAALAQAAHVPPSESRDQRRIERMKLLEESRENQEVNTARAAMQLKAEKEALSKLKPPCAYPAVSAALRHGAFVVLSISTCPTFHDLFVGLDAFLKWVAGCVCAAGVSLFIVYGILPASPESQGGK